MNKSLVTIAIPAYKSEFLSKCISSALSQTYRTIEVIVVDDKSPNHLDEIVKSFEDPRLKYIVNEKNLGGDDPGVNWNECLSYANGEFFCLLCDDDIYEPTFIETMIQLAERYPEANVFRSRVKIINEVGTVVGMYPTSPQYETSTNYMLDILADYRRQTVTEFMYRTEYIKRKGGYCLLPKAMCADYLTIFKLAKEGGIASCIEPLVSFRSSEINLSGKGQNKKNIMEKIISRKIFTDEVMNLIKDVPTDIRDIIIERAIKQHNFANIKELTWCSFSEFVTLFKNRSKYNIEKTSFKKAFIKRLIKLVK